MDWTLAPFTIYLGVKGKVDHFSIIIIFLEATLEDMQIRFLHLQLFPKSRITM